MFLPDPLVASDRSPAPNAFDIVIIASSQGGVSVLTTILHALPIDFAAPVLIVHHLSATHRSVLVELLGARSALPVEWATQGLPLRPGVAYVAPRDRHIRIDPQLSCSLRDDPAINHSRPSADPLLISAASTIGARVLAVVLSGRLSDGTIGAAAIREAGGMVLVQDPSTCAASGMPESVVRGGMADLVLEPAEIAPALVRLMSSRRNPRGVRVAPAA